MNNSILPQAILNVDAWDAVDSLNVLLNDVQVKFRELRDDMDDSADYTDVSSLQLALSHHNREIRILSELMHHLTNELDTVSLNGGADSRRIVEFLRNERAEHEKAIPHGNGKRLQKSPN